MLVATCAYFVVQEENCNDTTTSWIYILGIVIIILCFIAAIVTKISTDLEFKRGLMELARGKYEECNNLPINPAHINSAYDDTDDYETRYDFNDPE